METPLNQMGLAQAAEAVASGRISSERLVSACLERIKQREPEVDAWIHLDPEYALIQARAADRAQAGGDALGPLHGVPIGIKDIIDTKDMPTQNGTVLHWGRQPAEDAAVVSLLREAGAIILGKTVTAELAVYAPGKTKNPHDPSRTPGGSSSGSAAAVADFMAPGALGTQTNGSMIRPASFCGVVGYKPSFGRISRRGVLCQCPSLDQVGVFTRTAEDAALLAQTLMAYDPSDSGMRPVARPDLISGLKRPPEAAPRLALVKSPVWPEVEPGAGRALIDYAAGLGSMVQELELPPLFERAVEVHRSLMLTEMSASYRELYERGKGQLSERLRSLIEQGMERRAVDYIQAGRMQQKLKSAMHEAMGEYDAIITPASTGEAPVGLETTGNPICCTIWTLCGLPSITLPLLKGRAGMPLGVQLVGRAGEDAKLLCIAGQLMGN